MIQAPQCSTLYCPDSVGHISQVLFRIDAHFIHCFLLHKVDKRNLDLYRGVWWHLRATSTGTSIRLLQPQCSYLLTGSAPASCGSGDHLALILETKVAGMPLRPKCQLWGDSKHALPACAHRLHAVPSNNAEVQPRDDLHAMHPLDISPLSSLMSGHTWSLATASSGHIRRH